MSSSEIDNNNKSKSKKKDETKMIQLPPFNPNVISHLKSENNRINIQDSMLDINQKYQKLLKTAESFLEHPLSVTMFSLFTLYALFSDDARIVTTNSAEADLGFSVAISITFFLFIFEIILGCIAKPDYLFWPDMRRSPEETFYNSLKRRAKIGSFYFWLDCIATLTLLFDMPWIVGGSGSSSSQAQKAGVASRAGII